MTEEHWKVIRFLREYFLKFGVAPMIRKLTKETGMPLKHIYQLFPTGPAKGRVQTGRLAQADRLYMTLEWRARSFSCALLYLAAAVFLTGMSWRLWKWCGPRRR